MGLQTVTVNRRGRRRLNGPHRSGLLEELVGAVRFELTTLSTPSTY